MTREIKFRLPIKISSTQKRFHYFRLSEGVSQQIWDIADGQPQQYIGLTDINGVEIYEGDIIQLESGSDEFFVAPVAFDDGRFVLKHPEGYHGEWGLSWRLIDACNYKVIGNICENPELVKESTK